MVMHCAQKVHFGKILSDKWYFVTVRKKCSSDREKLLKFEAKGPEFTKILRLLE